MRILFIALSFCLAFCGGARSEEPSVARSEARGAHPESKIMQDADVLFSLLHNRAAMMRAVAVAKWRNGGAIEDLKREEQVVARAKDAARRAGLTDVSATTRAQIHLAKIIQARWHGRWAREGLAGNEYSIPLTALRARLDVLDAQILTALSKALPVLREEHLRVRLKTIFLRRFRAGALLDEERLTLFNALLQVRQAPREND